MTAKYLSILLGVMLSLLSLTAAAQKVSGFVEGQGIVSNGAMNTTAQSLVNYTIGEKTGLYMFAQTGATWRQFYVGPTYSPASWMQVGVGYGLERARDHGRVGSFIWLGKGPVSLLAIHEDGGSGPWHKIVANYAVTKTIGVGMMHQAFLGVGPRAELHIGKYMVWGAYLKDGKERKQTFAVDYNF